MNLLAVLLVVGYLLAAGLTYEIAMTGWGWRKHGHPDIDDGVEWVVAAFLALCCPLVLSVVLSVYVGRYIVRRFFSA